MPVVELPQLTRGLRAFATPPELGERHQRFFAPLLAARRSAARGGVENCLRAFNGDRLAESHRVTLRVFADEVYPDSAPDARGLTAQMEDACARYFDELATLDAAAARVREAVALSAARDNVESATPEWNTFVLALQRVFIAADQGWEGTRTLLDGADAPGPPSHPRRRERDAR